MLDLVVFIHAARRKGGRCVKCARNEREPEDCRARHSDTGVKHSETMWIMFRNRLPQSRERLDGLPYTRDPPSNHKIDAVAVTRPREPRVPSRRLPLHQPRRDLLAIAKQIMLGELSKLSDDLLAPRPDPIDHRVRIARHRHRIRFDELALRPPLL